MQDSNETGILPPFEKTANMLLKLFSSMCALAIVYHGPWYLELAVFAAAVAIPVFAILGAARNLYNKENGGEYQETLDTSGFMGSFINQDFLFRACPYAAASIAASFIARSVLDVLGYGSFEETISIMMPAVYWVIGIIFVLWLVGLVMYYVDGLHRDD